MGLEFIENRLDNISELLSRLSKKIEITLQDIKIENLENGLNGLTIAQISDLHIHEYNIELIEHTIEILNKLNPDIVTMTGDAICNGQKFIPELLRLFKKITPRYGKFACLGNHDHSDHDDGLRIQKMYKKSDFQILVNDSAKININGDNLYIGGADDIELGEQNIIKMVKNIPEAATKIFLTHNPYNFKDFAPFAPDIVLAGHTHGGQLYCSLLEFIYQLKLHCNYISGFYKYKDSKLYVNRGIGTAVIMPEIFGKKFVINTPRVNSKPEITLFRLIKKQTV